MRTNIDIDDDLMAAALKAGPYKTKKEAVEAGLQLLKQRAAYQEVLKWRGKLKWDGEPWDTTNRQLAAEPSAAYDAQVGERMTAKVEPVKPAPPRTPRGKTTNSPTVGHGRR